MCGVLEEFSPVGPQFWDMGGVRSSHTGRREGMPSGRLPVCSCVSEGVLSALLFIFLLKIEISLLLIIKS